LEAVYPDAHDPTLEVSFEELRAIKRGWAARDWRQQAAGGLRMMSGNVQPSPPKPRAANDAQVEELGVDIQQNLTLDNENSSQIRPTAVKETKPAKPRRIKVREIKQEAQTGQLTAPLGG
jgi:checkpoint serine/threonine-protein kinase